MRSALEGLVWLLENVEGGDEDEGVDSVQWGSGRLHRWAHIVDGVSNLPVLLCVGGKQYANQTVVDFAEETLDASTARRIESVVSAETRRQLFKKGYDGNTIYVPSAAIVVRVDDRRPARTGRLTSMRAYTSRSSYLSTSMASIRSNQVLYRKRSQK